MEDGGAGQEAIAWRGDRDRPAGWAQCRCDGLAIALVTRRGDGYAITPAVQRCDSFAKVSLGAVRNRWAPAAARGIRDRGA
ncbi:hypothetical protein TIFTF001_053708 [Ficus carica]|uniref:Uncharacterized protein n=1 Tax=Ficus carica TaxID=3494 RepID=A0AA88EF39_FICCA|nr:hypothetical protein TIFTF001_053705 [Ficus carica]GMN73515.1 hypothetical protein TIFTF001_053708 [Ficus carica]